MSPDSQGTAILPTEDPIARAVERLARLERTYEKLTAKADLANLETRLNYLVGQIAAACRRKRAGTVTGTAVASLI